MEFQERQLPRLGKRPVVFVVVAVAASLMLTWRGPRRRSGYSAPRAPARSSAPRRPTWSKVVGATTGCRAAVGGIDSSERAAPTA